MPSLTMGFKNNALIVRLFKIGCPPAIGRGIGAFIINSLKGHSRRGPRSHVADKIGKATSPLIANSNPAPAIVLVTYNLRSIASAQHGPPDSPLRGFMPDASMTMLKRAGGANLATITPATPSQTLHKRTMRNYFFISTSAAAKIISTRFVRCDSSKHFQYPKRLAGKILFTGHLLILLTVVMVIALGVTKVNAQTTTYTPNFHLALPYAVPGSWGELYNSNFQTLDSVAGIGRYTVATKPTAPVTNQVIVVTDAASASTCTTGGGTTNVTCQWTGTTWVPIGGGAAGSSPVGASGDVQYNSGTGGLGAEAAFNYNAATDVLSVPSLTVNAGLKVTSDIEPTTITSDQNNYAGCNVGTNSVCRVSTDASRTVTGIAGGSDGFVLFFYNAGANDVVLAHQNASSTAVNRLSIGSSLTLTSGQGLILQYDAVATRWRAASGVSGGGSGGAPTGASYITQTPDGTLSSEFALSSLATGLLKNTTGTGVPTIAVTGTDYYAPGGADVVIADGGTGASTAAGARTNLAVPGLADANTYTSTNKIGTTGGFSILGSASGEITFGRSAAAGTYNFNLPTTAGTSGQPLLSGGGGATAMSFGTLGFAGGGTGATSFTASRCVRVNSAGTALEVAAADCAAGGSITGSGTTGKHAKFTGASAVGDSSYASEDGSGMLVTGTTRYGSTGVNDYTPDFSAITGNKTRTMKNVDGSEVVSTGTLTNANLAQFDSSGRIVNGPPSVAMRTRSCEIVVGDPDSASAVLANGNDSPAVCGNVFGQTLTITAVYCYANAGSPTVRPQVSGGASNTILSADLTCTSSGLGGAGTLNGTPTLTTSQTIDGNIVSAGTAKYIVMRIVMTLPAS